MRSLIALLSLSLAAAASSVYPYTIKSLIRSIEVGGTLSRTATAIVLEYDQSTEGTQRWYDLPITDDVNAGRLAWLEADVGEGRSCEVRKGAWDPLTRTQHYRILLPLSASTDRVVALTIQTDHLYASVPLPSLISQVDETQYLLSSFNLLDGLSSLTPSHTFEDFRVRVKLATPKILSKRAPDGVVVNHAQGASTVVFSLEGNKVPEGVSAESEGVRIEVHHEHTEPLVRLRETKRTVTVSHWGNKLSFDDEMDIYNGGPKLKGHFARILLQQASFRRQPHADAHALSGLTIQVPPRADSPYFIDSVGNVSTSRFRPSSPPTSKSTFARSREVEQSLLQIQPRYPIFGGWNYSCMVGWKLPLEDFAKVVSAEGGARKYSVRVPFMSSLAAVAVDKAELRVVLPEGASNIEVHVPFPLTRLSLPASSLTLNSSAINALTTSHATDIVASPQTYTYLDTTGRPTVILYKEIVSDKYAEDVIVEYSLGTGGLLRKPTAVAAVVAAGFAILATGRRVRWSLT